MGGVSRTVVATGVVGGATLAVGPSREKYAEPLTGIGVLQSTVPLLKVIVSVIVKVFPEPGLVLATDVLLIRPA
jgi:hypothetical protein